MSPSVSVRLLLTQSDARLVEFAREGHERAFEAIVQRYRRPLLGYCRRLLLRDERAEDALQQGLLQAWLALQGGCVVREVKPWLYRIVHNCALNALRVSGYDYNTLSESLRGADAPEQDLDRRIAVREALAGMAALPAMQREALMRTALDGHSHEQVARALGLSEGALRGLLYRARVSLRAATTALTPSPAISWAINSRAGTSAPLLARLAETGVGGGSVGLTGMLVKGGTIAITAGALAGGVAVVHRAVGHAHPSSPPGNSASREALLAPNEPSDATAGTITEPGLGQSSPSSVRRPRGPASHLPPSIHLTQHGWLLHRPDFPGFDGKSHGDIQTSRDSGTTTHDGQGSGRPSGGSSSGASDRKDERFSQGPDSSNGSTTSKDTPNGGGDKTTTASEASSSGKDSTSSGSGSGSSDSQTQTSSGTSTSTSGDSGSSSSGATTDSTSSGSKDGEPSSSTSGISGEKAPSISWEPLHSGANS